ncbi:DMT family transporter [Kitasatospora sp. NBC_01250]|uniref:DMT family transporter n=1 Tax=unclassified Kitasatospora TaxID=2633591 RepID=UPI002E1506E2|nr:MULTISPECIES: DMT family transporter [unclassified Kitasatospora]WSJ65330.1 DMT family transporter [Kitasatospora sp. NBC_01302]
MAVVLTVLFAVLAALSNATAMVLQRSAARTVPQSDAFSVRLMLDLVRHPVWLGGMLTVLCAAVFQALALAEGSLALVQPIFVTELTFVLLIACAVFRRRLPTLGWCGIVAVTVGIALALASAAPSGGRDHAAPAVWVLTLAAGGGAMVCCVLAALPYGRGKARAALFGTSAAIGYALTAALMKTSVSAAGHGVTAFFTCWATYAFAAVGGCSLFLLSNAVESGPLLASQPALTLGDAVTSLALGILVYGEHVRTGWWLLPEAVGALLVAAGVMVLPRVETEALGPRPTGR